MRRIQYHSVIIFIITASLITALPHLAFAEVNVGTLAQQQIDQVVTAFQTSTGRWFSTFQGYAYDIFYLVAVIEFAWGSGQLLLKGGDFGAWTVHLIRSCVSIGIFYAILTNYAPWGKDIVHGLSVAAGNASGTSALSPGSIVIDGFNVMGAAVNAFSWKPGAWGSDISLALAGIIAVVVFALIAAQMALVLIESFFALNAGVLLVGLAPAPWSNSYAMNAIRWVIATGMKLFMMELLVGVGQSMIEGFAAAADTAKAESLFVVVAVAIVLLALVEKLPSYAAALISGGPGASGTGLGAAAGAVAGALGGAGLAMAGAGMAANAAMQAAGGAGGDGAGASGGGEGASGAGGGGEGASGAAGGGSKPPSFASRVGMASGILAQHVGKDLAAKVAGIPGSNHGTMGGRMATRIKAENPDPPPSPPAA